MELISIALRRNFREVCSTIFLRQIDDMFRGCGIQQKDLPWEVLSQISGERRTRVERYYASLDWAKPADAQKFLDVISSALSQEYVSPKYKDQLRLLCMNDGLQVNDDTVVLPDQGQKHVSSNSVNTDSQPEKQTEERIVESEKKITAITRRDIIDKLCLGNIEGRLDLIEFLKMTWPQLDSMPSPDSRASLRDDIIRHIYSFPDWKYDYLLYEGLKLGDCDDELFTTFLASCIHPLVRPDKKEVAALLSSFNEALRPDGYVLRSAFMQSGRPIYAAFMLGDKDEEYVVPRAIEIIEQLARKFHLAARTLSQRYDHRLPFEIQDEYDVQDLFYALLMPFFEDIRKEEVAPSYAGGHPRIDFLIKDEQIVIEIKKTRPSLKVRELRDQLIVDKEIYRTHPNCRTFIAFVYDPDGYIHNPIGFENDLNHSPGDMRVKVIVAPH